MILSSICPHGSLTPGLAGNRDGSVTYTTPRDTIVIPCRAPNRSREVRCGPLWLG